MSRRERNHGTNRKRHVDEYDQYEEEDPAPKKQRSRSPDRERDRYLVEREERMAQLRRKMQEEDQELNAIAEESAAAAAAERPQEEILQMDPGELEGLDQEEQMRRMLGFSGSFGSTKGQAVKDNQSSAARGAASKNKARKYRQYMNRKNGFNRPLDKMD